MLEIDFDKIHEKFKSQAEIKEILDNSANGFKFRKKINRARHYSDLALDCLEVAYVGDQLCKYAEKIKIDRETNYMYDSIVEFTLKPKDTLQLSNLIFQLGFANMEENDEFMEALLDYKEMLEVNEHQFPELIDDYYVNFINGEYYEYDPIENKEFFDKEFSIFPERKFGFFKSAFAKGLKQDFFTSTDSIIVPSNNNLDLILKEYSGLENLVFSKADFFAIGNITYLISHGFIVHFPFDAFLKAKHCAHQVLYKENSQYEVEGSWMEGFLSFRRWLSIHSDKENYRGYPEDMSDQIVEQSVSNSFGLIDPPLNSFFLSSYGDHILVKDSQYSYFFFGTDKLTNQELGFLGNNLSRLFRTTANLAGFLIEINCPWEKLNDETFEDLCFDIIYHNPKFNNNTIRKMGKTKSRDGGRDITIETHPRPGKPAKKFIFQCKYLRSGSSLTGSKVTDISDTVTQYEAFGYGIMTNVTIDSTLYDKLDGISRNLKIEIEDYSVYNLERILAGYPHLKKRYFKD